MSKMKIENAHQFYRDVFTKPINAIEDDGFSRLNIARGLNNKESILEILSSNHADVLHLISISNFFTDSYIGGNAPLELKNYVLLLAKEISEKYKNDLIDIICAKTLFRCSLVENFFDFIESKPQIRNNHNIQIILALVFIFEEDYENAVSILADLMSIPHYRNHFLFNVMSICAFYKCGGVPELPIDLTNIIQGVGAMPAGISWLTPMKKSEINFPIVFTASDPIYFWNHALFNFYSFAKLNSEGGYHFHLYNPDDNIVRKINSIKKEFKCFEISATSEIIPQGPFIKPAYTLNRFSAIHEVIRVKKNSIFSVDADSLWNGSIKDDFDGFDMAFCGSTYYPFWESNLGGACFFGFNEKSDFFLSLMSKFSQTIKEKNQGIWFQDQIALKICEETTSSNFDLKILRLDTDNWCDTEHKDESILWQVTTRKDRPKYNFYKKQIEEISKNLSKEKN